VTSQNLRFKTKELGLWIIDRNPRSDERQDPIQQIENRFRSGGVENQKNIYMDLYPK
jgi:hypothetical protein